MVKTTNNPNIFSKKCEECGKEISSLSESQFNYNYEQHIKSHERRENNKDENTQSKSNAK